MYWKKVLGSLPGSSALYAFSLPFLFRGAPLPLKQKMQLYLLQQHRDKLTRWDLLVRNPVHLIRRNKNNNNIESPGSEGRQGFFFTRRSICDGGFVLRSI